MQIFITIIHVITCLLMVLVVLLQSGKGAEVSATFGGTSQSIFGTSGGVNFFTKLTAGLAVVFMTTSLLLTIASRNARKSVFEKITTTSPIAAEKGNPLPVSTPPEPTPEVSPED